VIRTLRSSFLAALVALCAASAHAQQASEATVKAAFLYKFVGYAEWPATAFAAPDAPVVIAVSGNDEVAAELEKLVPGRNVTGRAEPRRRLREAESPRGVHMVFIGRGAPNPAATVRAAHQGGALVVTENGLEQGGAINLIPVEDRIGFEVSLESAEKSGVRLSSRMLTVARRVVAR
jgi:hypothetical protein